jgi:hypothetical protein
MAQPNNTSFQPGYNPYDGYGGGYAYGSGFRRINGLEIIVVLLSFLALTGTYAWGLLVTNAENRDAQRRQDISQVVEALQSYYKNTSGVPSERRYPVALCSADLNEVDFESTVRLALTGQQKAKEPHAYINPADYPKDKWGQYATDFTTRQVVFRCPQLIGGSGVRNYSDNYPSCEFSAKAGFRKCYLYTSSNNGDQYQIAYFSESSNKFIVYQQFREEQIKIVA